MKTFAYFSPACVSALMCGLLSLSPCPSATAQAGVRPVLVPARPVTSQAPAGQAPTAPSPGLAGPSPAVSPNYRIGPNDQLEVTVWKEQNLSGTFPVRPDGMISLVLLGDVQAAGKTPMALSEEITDKLKKYIQDPLVTVTVMAVNSKKIYVMGEVNRVGPEEMTADMTPLQAISAAGGITPYANAKKCYILRGEPGKQTKIPFDYKKALKGEGVGDLKLVAGDTVVVP